MEIAPAELGRLMSMPELHATLCKHYSNVPSTATMKRWSSKGLLDRAKRPGKAGRTPFHLGDSITVIKTLCPMGEVDVGSRLPDASTLAKELARELGAHLGARPEPAESAPSKSPVTDPAKLIEQTNAVRSTLMNKYDAAYAQQGQVVETLRERLKESATIDSLSREMVSMRVNLSKLQDAVVDRHQLGKLRAALEHLAQHAKDQEDRTFAGEALRRAQG